MSFPGIVYARKWRPMNLAFPRVVFGAGPAEPDGALGGGLRDGRQWRPSSRPAGQGCPEFGDPSHNSTSISTVSFRVALRVDT